MNPFLLVNLGQWKFSTGWTGWRRTIDFRALFWLVHSQCLTAVSQEKFFVLWIRQLLEVIPLRCVFLQCTKRQGVGVSSLEFDLQFMQNRQESTYCFPTLKRWQYASKLAKGKIAPLVLLSHEAKTTGAGVKNWLQSRLVSTPFYFMNFISS